MKNTKIRVAIIAALSIIAVVLGIIAFMHAEETADPVTIPTPTPQVVEIKIIPTPSSTPPPTEEPVIEEVVNTPAPTKAPTVQTEKSTKVTGVFALGIDGRSVQVANGVEEKTLEKSPGWLDSSAKPGEEGVCG